MAIFQDDSLVLTHEDAVVLNQATLGLEGWAQMTPAQRARFDRIIRELRYAAAGLQHLSN